MNVDEAMETAKAYLVAREQMQEPLFESEEVAVTLAREVERLRVWKTRWKDAAQKLRRQLEESGDGDTWRRACRRVELELEKTHTEVERLRAELAAAMAEIESVIRLGPHPVKQVQMPLATFIRSRMVARWEYNALVEKLEKAEAELAEAKAASVCPVEMQNEQDGEQIAIKGMSHFYGDLWILHDGDEYFWLLDNYNGGDWQPITKQLYDALLDYNKRAKEADKTQPEA